MKKACKTLNISCSGDYEYLKRKPSAREIENGILSEEINFFLEHKGRYGSLRIDKTLKLKGIKVNRKRVARLIHLISLIPCGTRYRYKHYSKKYSKEECPNLLNKIFKADAKNKIWGGDITYTLTKKKTLYLVVFIDIFSRKVVGWAMDTKTKEYLVISAFNQAYGKEHPNYGLVVHTDQGSQFIGKKFRMILKSKKAVHSQSRKGIPYDNALMKSFYRTLKKELIQDPKFKTTEQAQKEIFKYIEFYYNGKRMHSSSNFLYPINI